MDKIMGDIDGDNNVGDDGGGAGKLFLQGF